MSISVDPTLRIGAFNASRSGAMLPICLAARSPGNNDEPVGIGLTNPSGAKLHVNGNVKINSTRAIVGWASGSVSTTTTGTISFGVTFPSPPVVIARMYGQSDTNLVLSVVVSSVTTTGFNYSKTYTYGTTGGQNGNGNVSWFAVLLA